MANTIRVIDLLNKIANEEEAPEKIKGKNNNYVFNEKSKRYELENEPWCYLSFSTDELGNELEILEEQQDIDIQEIEEMPNKLINTEDPIEHIIEQHKKINKLVQAVKQLDRNIKDKE